MGDFKKGGKELRPKGCPQPVRVHDFEIPDLGKVAPDEVYDISANKGWVNLGIDHDTGAFVVESRRRWWSTPGQTRYLGATRLLITADCGGSNSARVRRWKRELQNFANETGLAVTVAHHPPGTSKWNRIEHKLFAFMTQNWRGKPLASHQVIVKLIGATTTRTGLEVQCCLDPKAVVPIEARLSQSLRRLLMNASLDIPIPEKCNVIDVLYSGDEGGIICCLDIGGPQTKNAHLVSIAHLAFSRATLSLGT